MKIALISDIHANGVALEAVLKDLQCQDIDEIICLGDVATIGPQPLQVLQMLQDLNCVCIRGNHDAALLDPAAIPRYRIASPLIPNLYWCRQKLGNAEFSFLKSFETTCTVNLRDGKNLLCFHGSPYSTTDVILASTPPGEYERMLRGIESDYLAGGHTHLQMLREWKAGFLINPGSVGCAFTRFFQKGEVPALHPWADYAILNINSANLQVDLRQVHFNIPAFKQAVMESDIPLKEWWLGQYNGL